MNSRKLNVAKLELKSQVLGCSEGFFHGLPQFNSMKGGVTYDKSFILTRDSLGPVSLNYHDSWLLTLKLNQLNNKEIKMAKEIKQLVKKNELTEVWKVPAYSGDKLVGWAEVETFRVETALLAKVKALVTEEDLININRQRITDTKNDLRRSFEVQALLAKVKAGKASSKEISRVIAAAAKGNLGKALQTELNALMMKVLSSK